MRGAGYNGNGPLDIRGRREHGTGKLTLEVLNNYTSSTVILIPAPVTSSEAGVTKYGVWDDNETSLKAIFNVLSSSRQYDVRKLHQSHHIHVAVDSLKLNDFYVRLCSYRLR